MEMIMRQLLLFSALFTFIFSCSHQNSAVVESPVINTHRMMVNIQPETSTMTVEDHLSYTASKSITQISFLLNQKVKNLNVNAPEGAVDFSFNKPVNLKHYFTRVDSNLQKEYAAAGELIINLPHAVTSGEFIIRYTLPATDSVDKAAFSREYIAYEVKGYIGNKGVFISPHYFWYPDLPHSLPQFEVQVNTPDNLYILTQGKLMSQTTSEGIRQVIWKTGYPTEGIHLVGSNYDIQSLKYKNIDIYTYFFPETKELSERYLSACQRYLAMYEDMIGPYPFSKFAVVENFFPTGYGMPSYTLLGSQIIRLPFIIYTSLGHEITHNWWGNSVYVDYHSGNWCEGLTTYFADYHYKELKSPEDAKNYRRDILRDFSVYVKKDKDFPLSEFQERTETASRAIGYGKSAMLFHQLRRIIGDSLFYRSFRVFYRKNKFRKASWQDIEAAAEEVSGQQLGWFFRQWVQKSGAPKITLSEVSYKNGQIEFTLKQEGKVFRLYLPVRFKIEDKYQTRYLWFDKARQDFRLKSDVRPQELAIDPNFDVFRRLDRDEIPPTMSEILARKQAILVLPDHCPQNKMQAYRQFARMLSEAREDITLKQVNEVSEQELQNYSFYLLGTMQENSLWKSLKPTLPEEVQIAENAVSINGNPFPGENDLVIANFRIKDDPARNVCLVAVGKNGQVGRVGTLITHYGKYSFLNFTRGRNSLKGIYRINHSPLIYQFD